MNQYFKLLPQKSGFVIRSKTGEDAALLHQAETVEFIFDVQPEDDIGGAGEIVLMTNRLVTALKPLEPSGITFRRDNLKVSGNDQIKSSPGFGSWWIADIAGEAGKGDFGYQLDYLVVSERVMQIVKDFTLRWCQIEPY